MNCMHLIRTSIEFATYSQVKFENIKHIKHLIDMPKLPSGTHEMEVDITVNGQQYVQTKLKILFLRIINI